jgi:AhpD family alkylhydroperoxidase
MPQHVSLQDNPSFPDLTLESAPPAARRTMAATQKHLGYLPAATARMAASPQLLDGFMRLNAIFESSTLSPLARETLVMTIATRNGCHICIAMHTARLTALGADANLIAGLRNAGRSGAGPLPDPALEAVRAFTLQVLDTAGDVGDQALRAFLATATPARTHSRSYLASALTPCPPSPTASPAPPSTTSSPRSPDELRPRA